MKANELMIGDWVNLSKGNWSENKQVGLIDIEMIAESVYLAEPIPLAAEILEKNGFIRFGTDYILKDRRFGLENSSTPSNYLDNYWLRVSIKAVHIEYVHELQHAMRLCGIEKEIEL